MNVKKTVKIQFLGAAQTVTGSKYLIDTGNKKLLIDCGMFQGLKELRQLNWNNLPFDVSKVDYVILTHGHLDHVGYLPLLVRQGFKGTIFATQPTLEIARLILSDSAKIQEEDANRANARHYSKHHPAKPLYSLPEAEAVFPLMHPQKINTWITLSPDISCRFRTNGHILGSTFIELSIFDTLFVFSGDIGREKDPLMFTPEKPEKAAVLFIESTYGNRTHPPHAKELLADAVNKATSGGGTLIIPGFAVERTQLLMFYLWQLQTEKRIPPLPVYMDSPMGASVLELFQQNTEWHKLAYQNCIDMCRAIKIVQTQDETLKIANSTTSKIIIAGSGMASGGRVLTYFEHYLNDAGATILFTGYQGEGTRGRALLEGAKEIKMRGKLWPVKAQIALVEGLSAHADQGELIRWLDKLKELPEKIFIVHGEKAGAEGLKSKLEELGHSCEIPFLNQEYDYHIN